MTTSTKKSDPQDRLLVVPSNFPMPYGMKEVRDIEKKVYMELNGGRGGGASSSSSAMSKDSTAEDMARALVAKKQSRAMGMATSPGKQMMMNAFMLYMSGKSLNIFSISVTGQAIMTPLKGLFGVNTAFRQFEDASGKVDLQLAKAIWIVLNCLWLGVGLYKMSYMRLLPTTSADWAGSVPFKEIVETSIMPAQWF